MGIICSYVAENQKENYHLVNEDKGTVIGEIIAYCLSQDFY